jgi:hypothetical protein
MRSPFFTKQVVQFAFSTDEWMRHRGTQHRWLYRQAMNRLLPSAVLDRPKKADFMVAVYANNDEVRESVLETLQARRREWFDVTKFDGLAREIVPSENAGLGAWVLWYAACCDAVVDARAAGKETVNRST